MCGKSNAIVLLLLLLSDMGHNTADALHVLTEAVKLSFTDAFSICADPNKVLVPRKKACPDLMLRSILN